MIALNKRKNQGGFTLIEVMLALTVAAVMFAMKIQDDQLELQQLQSRKLGATELAVYNQAVQRYLSRKAGTLDPTTVTGSFTGIDWLKGTDCGGSADIPYLECSFLQASNGSTSFGGMDFSTTITHDPGEGYQARTVMSPMFEDASGEPSDDNYSGILGLAALVASSAFNTADPAASSGGGSYVQYCPDINPMPSSLAARCGTARDQIVMIAQVRGADDQWLRVDHGNTMQNIIEMKESGATAPPPSDKADVDAIDGTTVRQIRNVARIYNLNPDADNDDPHDSLILGSRLGEGVYSTANFLTEGVIIDADQEILGNLRTVGRITATEDIESTGGSVIADQNLEAGEDILGDRDLEIQRDATINGWVQAQEDIESVDGDIVANSGEVISNRFVDSANSNRYVDPVNTSQLEAVRTNTLEALSGNTLNINANRVNFRRTDGSRSSVRLDGLVRAHSLNVQTDNTGYRPLRELVSGLDIVGSYRIDSGGSRNISAALSQCRTNSDIRGYVTNYDNIQVTESGSCGSGCSGVNYQSGQTRHVLSRSGNTLNYYQYADVLPDDGSVVPGSAVVLLACRR